MGNAFLKSLELMANDTTHTDAKMAPIMIPRWQQTQPLWEEDLQLQIRSGLSEHFRAKGHPNLLDQHSMRIPVIALYLCWPKLTWDWWSISDFAWGSSNFHASCNFQTLKPPPVNFLNNQCFSLTMSFSFSTGKKYCFPSQHPTCNPFSPNHNDWPSRWK